MKEEFDDQFAAELLGTYVLAGVTDVNYAGAVIRHWQVHGRVIRADADSGVIIETPEGKEQWLPPDPPSYIPADPGEYRLASTQEIVIDPDYVTTWTRHPPEAH
jgi:hypothetical protein